VIENAYKDKGDDIDGEKQGSDQINTILSYTNEDLETNT